jgi:DnaJ domain
MGHASVKAETTFIADNNKALAKVLMDFKAAPGGYALNLGQPVLIFQYLDTVIAWAAGKVNGAQAVQSDVLQQAAIFFIQRACFRQENTHYDVMGLERKFSPDTLRLRYRALISLTHPDKNISGLPANAAVRINKAYETLSDFDIRTQYDASLSDEQLVTSRSTEHTTPAYSLGRVAFISRLQAYVPDVRKVVIFALPISVVLLIVVMTASQNPNDLLLVEKSSINTQSSSSFSSPTISNISVSAVSANTELKESGRQLLLQNKVTESLLSPIRKANVQSEYLPTRAKSKIAFEQPAVLAPVEVIQNSNSMNSTISAINNRDLSNALDPVPIKPITTATATPAADVSNLLSLKVSSSIPVMAESKRLYAQLNEARFLTTQLISALERPKDAEVLQNKMMKQGVSGNLFGLALPHIRQSAAVRIDQLALKEKLDNNHLILSGSVALWLGATTSQLMPYKYAINVEFKNLENGPVMSSFDLKESR